MTPTGDLTRKRIADDPLTLTTKMYADKPYHTEVTPTEHQAAVDKDRTGKMTVTVRQVVAGKERMGKMTLTAQPVAEDRGRTVRTVTLTARLVVAVRGTIKIPLTEVIDSPAPMGRSLVLRTAMLRAPRPLVQAICTRELMNK